jgi:FkbM family methyltransferase
LVQASGDRLQVGVDAIRRDQFKDRSSLTRSVAASEATQQVLERFVARANEDAGIVHKHLDDVSTQGQRTEASIREGTAASLKRLDDLLGRVCIPLGNELLVRTKYGYILVPAEDRALIAAVWEHGGILEPHTVDILTTLLHEGDTFVDVGANIGLLTVPAARKVGPTGHVLAVEPNPRACEVLRQTLATTFMTERVDLQACAAGAKEGEATLMIPDILGHASLLDLPEAKHSERVRVAAVDSLVGPGLRVNLVKIDAEGYELEVWRGMQRVIGENPDLVVIVEFGPEHLRRAGVSVETWIDEIRQPDFTAFEIDEMAATISPLRSFDDLEKVFSLNLLLLRKSPQEYPELRFVPKN